MAIAREIVEQPGMLVRITSCIHECGLGAEHDHLPCAMLMTPITAEGDASHAASKQPPSRATPLQKFAHRSSPPADCRFR